jgi:hypothetical protein
MLLATSKNSFVDLKLSEIDWDSLQVEPGVVDDHGEGVDIDEEAYVMGIMEDEYHDDDENEYGGEDEYDGEQERLELKIHSMRRK